MTQTKTKTFVLEKNSSKGKQPNKNGLVNCNERTMVYFEEKIILEE